MTMDTLRSAAHLQRELGDKLFAALVSSNNTAAVREFAENLDKSSLSTEMTIGGRTYDILSFLKGSEKYVVGHTMVNRAKEMKADLGQEEGEHLLEHQDEIPAALCGNIIFVFTDWLDPDDSDCVAFVYWDDDLWAPRWYSLHYKWRGVSRVLRRK